MLTVNKLIPQGQGLASVLVKRAATVDIDWDVRQKSRFDATDSQGRSLDICLPSGTQVRGGDILVAEDGSLIRVLAAPQEEASAPNSSAHGNPAHGQPGHVHGPGCGHDHGAPASRGKPVGIAIKGETKPHVHGPGCGHDH